MKPEAKIKLQLEIAQSTKKMNEWRKRQRELLATNPNLKREYRRENNAKMAQDLGVTVEKKLNLDVDKEPNGGIIKGVDNRNIKGFPEYVKTYDNIVNFNREITNYDLSKQSDNLKYHQRLNELVAEVKELPFLRDLDIKSNKNTKQYGVLSLQEIEAIVIDSDDVKKYSAYYDNGLAADAIHKSSKKIVENIKQEFYTKGGKHFGDNVVLPIVGAKSDKIIEQLQPFIDAGYEVHLINSYGENKRSVLNALQRTIQDGRYVPLKILEKYENKPNQAFEEVKQMLKHKMKGRFYYEQYDTRTTSYGGIPKFKEGNERTLF